MTEAQQYKERAIGLLADRVHKSTPQLEKIDKRLLQYYCELVSYSGIDPQDPGDWHNLYELLSALKLLRIMKQYPVDVNKVQQVIRLREGEWHQEQGIWKYDSGGLLLPGTRGATHYRWMPFQLYVLASMYGAQAWIDTEVPNGSRELLPTEREGENGTIEDLRRLCTDFTFYAPRKTDKTGLSAYNNFLYFMLEDADSEIYCCANSQTQSKLLFDRTQMLIRQMDTQGKRIRFTATTTNWRPGQIRSSQLWALSAGGKTKDGLFAQLCCADEFGSAAYVNDKSDMGALVNVVLSSMGPRREPMMFTSTTAGTIQQGPFIDKLEGMKRELLKELDMPFTDGDGRLQSANDRWMILPLCPDEWQLDEEYLLTSKAVRRKVNPALGIIVQNSFYEQSVADSRLDPLKKIETLTKLFNVYQTGKVTDWIKATDIRPLQQPRKIEDCKAEDGWLVLCGMDFSKGDDLHAVTYLAVRAHEDGSTEFFADLDSWVTEKAVQESSIGNLLQKWIDEGWLHLSHGKVLQPSLPVNRIVDLIENHGVSFLRWGYDSYQNIDPINTLKAYLWDIKGIDPDKYVVPVRQTNASYNPAVLKMEGVIWSDPPLLALSASPLWPFEFGNAAIHEDSMRNRRMVKRQPGSDACKVDNVQALGTCFILLNQLDSKLQTTDQ